MEQRELTPPPLDEQEEELWYPLTGSAWRWMPGPPVDEQAWLTLGEVWSGGRWEIGRHEDADYERDQKMVRAGYPLPPRDSLPF